MKKRRFFLVVLLIFIIGLLLPQTFVIPVKNAVKGDWNEKSFWYYPWGKSVTHKGVDIFAKEGQDVISSTYGIVLYKGNLGRGGKVVMVLGPKWRIHYYSHLKSNNTGKSIFLKSGDKIGTVGKSGNTRNTPPHLHYSIATIIPYVWRIDGDKQGWKKMFYLNPIKYMNKTIN